MKNKIEREVMKEILSKKVKMKPRWIFELERDGARGIWMLVVLAGAVAFSMIWGFIELYKPSELLNEYGDLGKDLLISDFPYWWLVGAMIFFVGGVVMLTKLGDNYKRPTKTIMLFTAVLLIVLTGVTIVLRSLLEL